MADDSTRKKVGDASSERDSIEEPPPPEILKLDHVYEALAHPRRRYICHLLRESTQWMLIDLATKIAAWENDTSEQTVTKEQQKRVYVSLYHGHVPKLVDEGVVTFDDGGEMITAAENAKQVLAVLESIETSLDSAYTR